MILCTSTSTGWHGPSLPGCAMSTIFLQRASNSWAAPCEKVYSSMYGQRRPWSDCASAQSDQGLRCPLTESLYTTECMNGEQSPGWHFAHAQGDLNVHFGHVRRHFFAWYGPFYNCFNLGYQRYVSCSTTKSAVFLRNCVREREREREREMHVHKAF